MNKSGFTLVELSIVIIIIGLITGGVLGARSLIESGNRQAVMKDVTGLKSALLAFKLEYDALPGDFSEASDYFSGGNASETRDGDGDKLIENGESTRAFAHMGAAEIVNGRYADSGDYTPGETGMASATGVGGYQVITSSTGSSSSNAYGYNRYQVFIRYADTSLHSMNLAGGVYSAIEARKFDKKFDDGAADSGEIFVHKGYYDGGWQAGCLANNPAAGAAGAWSSSEAKHCNMIFWTDL